MSGQNTLVVIAEDAQVQRPGHLYNWQVYRDTAAPGSGTYKAMDYLGNIEIIGGAGISIPRSFGHFYFVGDAVIPGFHSPTGFAQQNNIGMQLDTGPTGDFIQVDEAGYYSINYSFGRPEGKPINDYAILINQENIDPGVDHVGSLISTTDTTQSMAGNLIVQLPANGTIQFRNRDEDPTLIHANDSGEDSVSIQLKIERVL